MSYLIEKEIVCASCQLPTESEIWSAINVKEDPELKEVLLGGELNMVMCDSCHEIFYADHFLLYQDPDAELMAFVYPLAAETERSKWEEKTRVDFAALQDGQAEGNKIPYEPLSLFGLDELVHLVEAEEEAGIQAEIVSLLSAKHGFPVKRIRPALARKHKLPTVIPFVKDESLSDKESVIAGLKLLLSLNDRLSVYLDFQKNWRRTRLWPPPSRR